MANTLPNDKKMNGRQKAAILCMILGAENAALITQRLSPDENESLVTEIASMEAIDTETANQVVNEWVETTQGIDALAIGGQDYAKEILEATFGEERAKSILKRVTSQLADTAGMQKLKSADPQQLGSMLRNEHPQSIAVVLANLDPAQAASVLRELGGAVGSEVLFRMARMEKVSPEILQMIERSIRAEGDLEMGRMGRAAGGPNAVATIINMLTGSLEKELMDGLSQRDAALCEQVKNLMFVFENVFDLQDQYLGKLIKEIDTRTLAIALKTALPEQKGRLQALMPKRAAEALTEEMESLGPTRKKDIEAAQAQIVEKVRKLEELGEIELGKGDAEDVVV